MTFLKLKPVVMPAKAGIRDMDTCLRRYDEGEYRYGEEGLTIVRLRCQPLEGDG